MLVAAMAAGGCADGDFDERANDAAWNYLRAAADGDVEQLCRVRTGAALRKWGGSAACNRRARGLAVDPVELGPGQAKALERKALGVDPREARVLPDDTSTSDSGDQARVVIDFGEAVIEDGHAVGGQVLELDLKRRHDEYRVAHLGFAAHAD
jgi:hypothetical protein